MTHFGESLEGFRGTITDSILHEALVKLEARERVLTAQKAELTTVKKAIGDIRRSLRIDDESSGEPRERRERAPGVSEDDLYARTVAYLRDAGPSSPKEIIAGVGVARLGQLLSGWAQRGRLQKLGDSPRSRLYDVMDAPSLSVVGNGAASHA